MGTKTHYENRTVEFVRREFKVDMEKFEAMKMKVIWASFRQPDGQLGKQVPVVIRYRGYGLGQDFLTYAEVKAILLRDKVNGGRHA